MISGKWFWRVKLLKSKSKQKEFWTYGKFFVRMEKISYGHNPA